MRQGEVWSLPGGHLKAVVISSDAFNELPGFRPIVAPLVRSDGTAHGLTVPTHEDADHVTGVVLVPYLMHHHRVGGTPDTTLSGATMGRLVDAVQQLFSY